MARAYSYIRWSSAKQTAGDSLRRQTELATAYAEKHNLELDLTHRDEGVSSYHGRHRKKGDLARFLASVQNGTIPRGSYLLVENLDRLSREDVETAMTQFLGLTKAGIIIVTLSDGREHSSQTLRDNPHDLFISLMVMIRANEENRTKGGRVRNRHSINKELARSTGRVWTKKGPSWAQFVDGKWAEVPERANAIRRIFDLYEAGLGMGAIALRMNEDGVPPLSARGWQRDTISTLLRSRTVIGEYQPTLVEGEHAKRIPDGPPLPLYYPEVIKPDQFWRVQERLAKEKRGTAYRAGRTGVANLFQGLCACSECGDIVGLHKSVDTPDGRHAALRCVNAALKRPGKRTGRVCDNRKRFRYKPLEAAILHHVCEIVVIEHEGDPLADELATAEAVAADLASQVDNLMRQLAAKDDARLRRFYDNQASALDAAEAHVATLRTQVERRGPRRSLEGNRQEAKALYAKLGSLEGQAYEDARAALALAIRTIVDVIDCDPNGDVRVILHGGRKAYRFRNGAYVDEVDIRSLREIGYTLTLAA